MDAASDPSVTEIVVQAGAQLGKTEVLLNVIGFHVAHDPAPILVVQPTGQKGMRSEERRVGKEWRSRGSPEH